MNVLFPYLARWHAVNWTRYHSLLHSLADRGHSITVLQPPPARLSETNFQEIEPIEHPGVRVIDVSVPAVFWSRRWPLDKLVKRAVYGVHAAKLARQLLVRERFDVLLTYNIPHYLHHHQPACLQLYQNLLSYKLLFLHL